MKEKKLFFKGELTPEQREKNKKIGYYSRIVACVVFLLALVGISYLVYPIFRGVGRKGWLQNVQAQISEFSGIGGVLVFLAIQALQVPVAVVPPIQLVGGALYGWFWGAIASYVGIALGSLLVWGIVKKLGAPLVQAIISEKHIKKFGFLEDEHKLRFILVLLYIIPGIPKDTLTYIVPMTKIKLRDFMLYVLPWRIPAIMLSAAVGSNATKGNYISTAVFALITLIVAIFGFVCKDKILAKLDKRKKRSKID